MKRFISLLVAVLAFACASCARACMLNRVHDPLSNYELVKKADSIVLARPTGPVSPARAQESPYHLVFTVTKVVKGENPGTSLELFGNLNKEQREARQVERDFNGPYSGTHGGGCSPAEFRPDSTYLLFLKKFTIGTSYPAFGTDKKGDIKWGIGMELLARDAEEIGSEQEPWMQAVLRHSVIAKIGDYEKEKDALAELRNKAALHVDMVWFPPQLVEDINRHFTAASPMKSYADLLSMYDANPGSIRAVSAMAAARYPQAFDLVYTHLGSVKIEYYGAVRHPRSAAVLAEEFAKRKKYFAEGRSQSGEQSDIAELLAYIATDADAPVMRSVLRQADTRSSESVLLARWFLKHPLPVSVPVLREIVGTDYAGKWGIAASLAALGDKAVLRWAKPRVAAAGFNGPVRIIAISPLAEADRLAGQIIASKDIERITTLEYGYRMEEAQLNPHRAARMREIAATKLSKTAPGPVAE